MAFPQTVKDAAFKRSGGRCECTRTSHGHTGRCQKRLTATSGHYHHQVSVNAGGADTLVNCEHMCIPCHEKTRSFGRS